MLKIDVITPFLCHVASLHREWRQVKNRSHIQPLPGSSRILDVGMETLRQKRHAVLRQDARSPIHELLNVQKGGCYARIVLGMWVFRIMFE